MYLSELTPGPTALLVAALEVDVWEGHLLRSDTDVAKVLCNYSLDNGPWNEKEDGNLTFRFTLFDWEKSIREILIGRHIHYTILGPAPMPTVGQLLKKRVFIADDNPETLLVAKTMLEDAGYHVRVSTCGMPVVSRNFSWVDLFILSGNMSDINGIDICRHLRQQSETRHTPVIIISHHNGSETEAFGAGANGYLLHPFQMHYFLNVVSRFVKLNV